MVAKLQGADMFCGAGGSTLGAQQSGAVDVVLAINHWMTAIKSHSANHPKTRHICARIDDIDPRHDKTLPDLDILLASPECTHHANARGSAPIDDQKRATAWHVVLWAEVKRPKWIVVENVREFLTWGPVKDGKRIKEHKGKIFEAWVNSLRAIGYTVDWRLLNAADFGEATSRTRLFVICRLGPGRIPWPEPTHAGRWRGAHEIIDFERPIESIFTRKRPLEEKTIRRIEIGLRKFVGEAANPFIIKMRGTGTAGSVNDPLPTLTAGGNHVGLAQPFQLQLIGRGAGRVRPITAPVPSIVAARENHGVALPFLLQRQGFYDCQRDKPPVAIDKPLPTITGNHCPAHVVMPFVVSYHGGKDPARDGTERQHAATEPLPTIDTSNRFALAAPYVLDVNHGEDAKTGDRVYSAEIPLGTLTAKNGKALALPFITEYFGTGGARSVDEPLSTCTTKARHGLAMAKLVETMGQLGVSDVAFRMLHIDELALATGFDRGYIIEGNKAEQTRQIGNAVPPGFMRAICGAIGAEHNLISQVA